MNFGQVKRGILSLKQIVFKQLGQVIVSATNRCNSRCRTCHIWKQEPKHDISLEAVHNLVDHLPAETWLSLTGGEFILHPRAEEIIELVSKRNRRFSLHSNGILKDRIIEIVKKYQIPELNISCDGMKEQYKIVRGVDNFDNVCEIIRMLKNATKISLNYTLSPLTNNLEELLKVKGFAEKSGLHLAIGVYDTPEFFQADLNKEKIISVDKLVGYPINKYFRLYNKWIEGKAFMPCFSIRRSLHILPWGEVSICQGKNIIIGNLNTENITQIWQRAKREKIFKRYLKCNSCWALCQRPIDIVINDILPWKILS